MLLLLLVVVLVLVLPVLVGPGAAKLEQHARPRRGGRGRRDSVNSRSPRDRGGGEYSGSDHRFSPILPSSLPPPLFHHHHHPAQQRAASRHMAFHASIINDLTRNLTRFIFILSLFPLIY